MGGIREASLEEVILKKEKVTTRQINRRWGERAVPEAEGRRERGHNS